VRAHDTIGPVNPPLAAPDLRLTDHLGQARSLRDWLAGRVSVVQTMFTGCTTVCPIQGALFAQVQSRLATAAARQRVQLLSLSIDPLADTPQALHAWLRRLQAGGHWAAGVPPVAEVDTLQRALDGAAARLRRGADDHSDKVYFFDAQSQLRWRSTSLPTVDEVMRVLARLAA
jgi:protein SCO1